MRLLRSFAPLLLLLLPPFRDRALAIAHPQGRIVIIVVWDGLRADTPNSEDTPQLMALMHEGVTFLRHHSSFPTLTMVNAAALATGATPGATGVLANLIYQRHSDTAPAPGGSPNDQRPSRPMLDFLDPAALFTLDKADNSPGAKRSMSSLAQEVLRAGGYVALIGSSAPTSLLHDLADEHSASGARQQLFLTFNQRSDSPMRAAIRRALPAAEAASRDGRPSLIVLWQDEPDQAEHSAGLGTLPVRNALRRSDAGLRQLRGALTRLGIARQSDLIVTSDHGCATIKLEVRLSDLLVTAGLKRSRNSDDVLVARNGGVDLVYLSSQSFPTLEARRAMLARIVDFAAAQDWCGVIFSHTGPPPGTSTADKNLGWIPGTFSQELVGIFNSARSPDLFISFREIGDNNRSLTGPSNRAFALGSRGQVVVKNHSATLLQPTRGVVYADNAGNHFTTGTGMHGAAGQYEIHSFLAAEGPDFKSHFIDPNPTSSLDLAPTLRRVLNLSAPANQAGRVLTEALAIGSATPASNPPTRLMPKAYLVLQGAQIESQLNLTSFDGEIYFDDSSVSRTSIGPPQ